MKILDTFFDFFAFTKGERIGLLCLIGLQIVIIVALIVVPHIMPRKPLYDSSPLVATVLPSNVTSQPKRPSFDYAKQEPSKPQDYRRKDTVAYRPSANYPQRPVFTVQANSADTLDLQEIRGIGPAFAKRIIKYRDQLGGFNKKEQLLEIWGIDSVKYEQIKTAFVIDEQNIRKININTTNIDTLKRHPYLDYYQAKAIVRYREENGEYQSIDAIRKLPLIDSLTYRKIAPYIDVKQGQRIKK